MSSQSTATVPSSIAYVSQIIIDVYYILLDDWMGRREEVRHADQNRAVVLNGSDVIWSWREEKGKV